MIPNVASARSLPSPRTVAEYRDRLSMGLAAKPAAQPKGRVKAVNAVSDEKPLPVNPRNRYERRKVRRAAEKMLRSIEQVQS